MRGGGAAQGAFGPIEGSHWLHEIAGLRIGGHLIEQARMLEMDLAPISRRLGHEAHGIVGYNILSRLVILVYYGAGEVTFASSEDPRPFGELGEPEHVIPFALLRGAMIVTRRGVNDGDEWPFLVDLGAQITMLTPEEVEEACLEMDTEPAQLPTMGLGPEGERPVFHRGMVESLRFGSLVFRDTPLYRADLPVFVALGYADRPAGILGNDLMGC